MMRCEAAHVVLIDVVFGESDDRQQAMLNEHLRDCPDCRTEERELHRLKDRLSAGAEMIPPGLELRLRASMRGAPPRGKTRPRGWLHRPVPVYAAGAAVVAAAFLARIAPELEPVGRSSRPIHVAEPPGPRFVPAQPDETGTWVLAPADHADATRVAQRDSL
jgi:anti-sigma factor RsiW